MTWPTIITLGLLAWLVPFTIREAIALVRELCDADPGTVHVSPMSQDQLDRLARDVDLRQQLDGRGLH